MVARKRLEVFAREIRAVRLLQRLDPLVEARFEEERDAEATAVRVCEDAMRRCFQGASAPNSQRVSDVDHERPLDWLRVDPFAIA